MQHSNSKHHSDYEQIFLGNKTLFIKAIAARRQLILEKYIEDFRQLVDRYV